MSVEDQLKKVLEETGNAYLTVPLKRTLIEAAVRALREKQEIIERLQKRLSQAGQEKNDTSEIRSV